MIREREILRVSETAVKPTIQSAEAAIGNHLIEGESKYLNPDDMGTDRAEKSGNYAHSMLHSKLRNSNPEFAQHLTVNYDSYSDETGNNENRNHHLLQYVLFRSLG